MTILKFTLISLVLTFLISSIEAGIFIPHCLEITNEDNKFICSQCLGGFQLDEEKSLCGQCPGGCLVCDLRDESCTECQGGYTREGPECITCSVGCESCQFRDTCSDCQFGYQLDFKSGKCLKDHPNAALWYSVLSGITILIIGLIWYFKVEKPMIEKLQVMKDGADDQDSKNDSAYIAKIANNPFGPETDSNMDHLNYSVSSPIGSFKKEVANRNMNLTDSDM